MNKDQAQTFIIETIQDILARENLPFPEEINSQSAILGNGGLLDSMQLVELMLALEDFCADAGLEFDWNNDATFSQKRSVYRSVGTLADFVLNLPGEQKIE